MGSETLPFHEPNERERKFKGGGVKVGNRECILGFANPPLNPLSEAFFVFRNLVICRLIPPKHSCSPPSHSPADVTRKTFVSFTYDTTVCRIVVCTPYIISAMCMNITAPLFFVFDSHDPPFFPSIYLLPQQQPKSKTLRVFLIQPPPLEKKTPTYTDDIRSCSCRAHRVMSSPCLFFFQVDDGANFVHVPCSIPSLPKLPIKSSITRTKYSGLSAPVGGAE